MNLLLLGQGTHDLASLFQHAGYQVVEVSDIVSCCRQLKAGRRAAEWQPSPEAPGDGVARDITIFNPACGVPTDAHAQPDKLLDYIISLARQLHPGWRLSMRHRRLEAPGGASIALTALEFSFLKMLAMAETGEAVSRRRIVQGFGEDYLSYDQNRLDTMVRRLRSKAAATLGTPLPLNTERVRGYSFGDLLIIDH